MPSLALANDEALFELAQGLGARLLKEVPDDDGKRLERAFLLCYGRPPSDAERNAVASFREGQLASFRKDPAAAAEAAPKGGAREETSPVAVGARLQQLLGQVEGRRLALRP